MHGCAPGSGGPRGERSGKFKHGRYTREARELGKAFRQMVKEAEVLVARVRDARGLKAPRVYRRRRHVREALAKAKAAAKEAKE
jgi:hypothetical protein